MSNGMNNKITMKCANEEISRLKEFVKNVDNEGNEVVFDFRKIIPPSTRPLFRFISVEYAPQDGILWMEKNWGCKYNTFFPKYGEEPNQIFFDTVHGTGLKVILKLSTMFPEILFKFDSNLYSKDYSCVIRNGEILAGTYYMDDYEKCTYGGINLIY